MEELSKQPFPRISSSHTGVGRVEFVKDVVEKIILKVFATEFEASKKSSHRIEKERYIRSSVKLSNKRLKETYQDGGLDSFICDSMKRRKLENG